MDFLNKAKGMIGGDKKATTGTTGTTSTDPNAQKQDYGDKAFAAAGTKFGYKGNAQTNEAITDGARGFFEKATGKKVPAKFSN